VAQGAPRRRRSRFPSRGLSYRPALIGIRGTPPYQDQPKDLRYLVLEGGPHAINWTHADEVNRALLDFVGQPTATPASRW
jgi:hypothetical protein